MKKSRPETRKSQFNTMAKNYKKNSKKLKNKGVRYIDKARPGKYSVNRLMTPAGMSERKELVTQISGAVNVGGIGILLNGLGAGTDINQRVGRVIKPIGIQWRGFALGPTAGYLTDFLRFTIVYDTQSNNGATPAYTDVFDSAAGGSLVNYFKNTKQYTDRFTIIRDEVITVQNQINTASSGGLDSTYRQGYVSLLSFPEIQFISTASGVPGTGAVYCFLASYLNAGTTSGAGELKLQLKFTYTDA